MSQPGQSPTGSPTAGGVAPAVLDAQLVLQNLASAVSALATATGSSSTSSWRQSKLTKSPEIFSAKNLEEEISGWPDWSFQFEAFIVVQDSSYRDDFEKCETAETWSALSDYTPPMKSRSERLYAILATHLKGRSLKLLKSEASGCGFRVWRRLHDELQPASRPRSLALAQSLIKYPPYKDSTSLLEWTLTFERLIAEYERVSSQKYSDDLKISTRLAGLPEDIHRYLQLQVSEISTCEKLRDTTLAFERTSSSWSTERVLKAIGAVSSLLWMWIV